MTVDAANDPEERRREPRRLRDLIAGGENWLTARIIKYAKERGYTPFTSTLEQAWLASIRGLSAPLITALEEGRPFGAVAAKPTIPATRLRSTASRPPSVTARVGSRSACSSA